MIPEYDIGMLEAVLHDFRRATGVTITFFNPELQPVTAKGTLSSRYCRLIASTKEGKRACTRSNETLLNRCRETGQAERHVCEAGLVDIAVPLISDGQVLGYLMLGQFKKEEGLPKEAASFSVDRDVLVEYYGDLPLLDDETITAIMHLAVMLTRYIVTEKLVKPRAHRQTQLITSYIEAHLTERLTVEQIAHAVHLSPSLIYKYIRRSYNCTAGTYVTRLRIERAVPLLESGNFSVEQVADAVGFSDAAYFSRKFKKAKGLSPLKYKKSIQN